MTRRTGKIEIRTLFPPRSSTPELVTLSTSHTRPFCYIHQLNTNAFTKMKQNMRVIDETSNFPFAVHLYAGTDCCLQVFRAKSLPNDFPAT